MELLDSKQSEDFVNALQDAGFDLSDWDYLETLLQAEGLDEQQMQDLEKFRRTIAEVSKKYSV